MSSIIIKYIYITCNYITLVMSNYFQFLDYTFPNPILFLQFKEKSTAGLQCLEKKKITVFSLLWEEAFSSFVGLDSIKTEIMGSEREGEKCDSGRRLVTSM